MKCETCSNVILGPNHAGEVYPDAVEYGGWCRACKKSVCADCFDEKAQRCYSCFTVSNMRQVGKVVEL